MPYSATALGPAAHPHQPLAIEAKRGAKSPRKGAGPGEHQQPTESENESAANSLVRMRRGDGEAGGELAETIEGEGEGEAEAEAEEEGPRRRGTKRARGGKGAKKADETIEDAQQQAGQ